MQLEHVLGTKSCPEITHRSGLGVYVLLQQLDSPPLNDERTGTVQPYALNTTMFRNCSLDLN